METSAVFWEKPLVVAVGASAGGLQSLQDMVSAIENLPQHIVIIIAQHMSPRRQSRLAELLSARDSLKIKPAIDGELVKGGHIYVTPPNKDITLTDGQIKLHPASSVHKPCIDLLFNSIAKEYPKKCVGIILTGTGTDGAKGITSIKKSQGFTIAEDPREAAYSEMPDAAICTQSVDVITRPREIMSLVMQYALHGTWDHLPVAEDQLPDATLSGILKEVQLFGGTDFTAYKMSTIRRRIDRRIGMTKTDNIKNYLKLIRKNPEELDLLHKDLMISVTAFFRDKDAFQFLRKKLALYLKSKQQQDEIRIWVPACASGEEPYTIAIILYELLGERMAHLRVQIFASDINLQALAAARRGIYAREMTASLSSQVRSRYFEEAENGSYAIRKFIKKMVLFSKHDVTAAPPFAKLDLISCRNAFIYFSRELQAKVLRSFHYALKNDALLFLGKSENIEKINPLFSPISNTNKLYKKKTQPVSRVAYPVVPEVPQITHTKVQTDNTLDQAVKQYFYLKFAMPHVVVNAQLEIRRISRNIAPYISLPEGEISSNLIKNVSPALQLEVRTLLFKCCKQRKKVIGQVKFAQLPRPCRSVLITVEPLSLENNSEKLYLITFEKQPAFASARRKKAQPSEKAEDQPVLLLQQELAHTKQQLQSVIEEVESTNEEFQSLNEELQSANEELQAANEELETSNEELQSANQEMLVAFNELQEVNSIVETKEQEIRLTSNKLQAILENSVQGYLLVNQQYNVISINKTAESIIVQLTGKPFVPGSTVFDCAPLQSLDAFKGNLDKAFNGEITELEAEEKDSSKKIWLRFRYTPVHGIYNKIETVLISYIDITNEVNSHKLIALKEANLNSVIENFDGYVWSMDKYGKYITFNSHLENEIRRISGIDIKPGDKVQGLFDALDASGFREWKKLYKTALEGKAQRLVHEFTINNEPTHFELSLNPIFDGANVVGLSCFARNITDQVLTEKELDTVEKRYRSLIENMHDGISLLSADGKFIYLTASVTRIMGYDRHELVGQHPANFTHPDDLHMIMDKLQALLPKFGQTINVQYRMKHKNGEWRWLNSNITNMLHEPSVNAIVFNYKDVTERTAAEEKLLQSREQLAASQKLAKVGSWEIDLENMDNFGSKKVSWSEEIYLIFGLPPDLTITSGLFFSMVYREDRDQIVSAVNKCIQEHNPQDVEYRVKLSDGSTRFIYDRLRLVNTSAGPRVSGACQDITELKEKELKIIHSEANLQAILNNTNTAFQLFDSDFNLIAFNQLAYQWTFEESGKKLEQGRHFSYYIAKEKESFFVSFYKQALAGKESRFEHRGRTTGRYYSINIQRIADADGNSRGICISTIDNTEQRLAEQTIKNSEELYRYLFYNSPISKWVCDKTTFQFLEVNDTAVQLYGYSKDEFLQMTAFDVRVADGSRIFPEVANNAIGVLKSQLATHRKKNGEMIYVIVSIHEINYKGHDAYLVLANDVSETLKLQKQLSDEKLTRQVEITKAAIYAQEVERNELSKELHDNVNQMLASAKLYLDTAVQSNRKNSSLLVQGREVLLSAIDELRRISKSLAPPSLGGLTLHEAIEELVHPLRISKKNVDLVVSGMNEDELNEDLKISIYRIVQEQVNNILKYAEASIISIVLNQSASLISLTVTDNGKGFDVSQKRSGIGINNICNRANTFNGQVTINSAPGKGCELSVEFKLPELGAAMIQ